MFIDEELENLIVDGGELTRSIYLKKKSGILQYFIDIHYSKRCRREYFFGNIVNQLGQHHFSCGALVSNLKEWKLFLIKLIEIVLTQFLLGATAVVPPCRIYDALIMPWYET